MIEAISNWLRHLVVLVLFAAILDMVLPTTTMQKYVRTIIGLVIVLSLLLPLRSLVDGLFTGKFDTAISGALLPITQSRSSKAGNVPSVSYSQDLRKVIQFSLEQNLPPGSINVELSTKLSQDGSTLVTGVYIVCQNQVGVTFHRQQALALQTQTAELLGLSFSQVHVTYPGGEV